MTRKPTTKKKKPTITVQLETEELELLKKRAKRLGMPHSTLAGQFVKERLQMDTLEQRFERLIAKQASANAKELTAWLGTIQAIRGDLKIKLSDQQKKNAQALAQKFYKDFVNSD